MARQASMRDVRFQQLARVSAHLSSDMGDWDSWCTVIRRDGERKYVRMECLLEA
jgi:hypothetical protein